MTAQSELKFSGCLELYWEAKRLSTSLRNYTDKILAELNTLDSEEISACVNHYCSEVERLQTLSYKIDAIKCGDAPNIKERTSLRQAIRTDLDVIQTFILPCSAALQEKMKAAKQELRLTQQRRKLSAYLRNPLMGQDVSYFDKRK